MKNTAIESPQKSQMELSDGSGTSLEKFLFTYILEDLQREGQKS